MAIYTYALALLLGAGAFAAPQSEVFSPSQTAVAVKDTPIKRGAPLGNSPVVTIAEVLKDPQAYAGKPVIMEGVIGAVCTKKGCWMEISAKKGTKGVRVTFKDYGFFVPTNSKGMKVRAEGNIEVKVLSKEDVDHYVGEGASIDRNPDGTANEVTFVADGVELRKK